MWHFGLGGLAQRVKYTIFEVFGWKKPHPRWCFRTRDLKYCVLGPSGWGRKSLYLGFRTLTSRSQVLSWPPAARRRNSSAASSTCHVDSASAAYFTLQKRCCQTSARGPRRNPVLRVRVAVCYGLLASLFSSLRGPECPPASSGIYEG